MKNLKTFEDYSDLDKQERAERNQISNFPHSAKEDTKKREKREKKARKEDPDGMYPRDDKRYDDSNDSSYQGGWQDGMGKPSWLGESVEDEEEIKDQFNNWYDSIDYTEADYTSFKAGYKIGLNQASRLPQERESLDDRIAAEFRRRYDRHT